MLRKGAGLKACPNPCPCPHRSPPAQQLSYLCSGLLSTIYLDTPHYPLPLLQWLFQVRTEDLVLSQFSGEKGFHSRFWPQALLGLSQREGDWTLPTSPWSPRASQCHQKLAVIQFMLFSKIPECPKLTPTPSHRLQPCGLAGSHGPWQKSGSLCSQNQGDRCLGFCFMLWGSRRIWNSCCLPGVSLLIAVGAFCLGVGGHIFHPGVWNLWSLKIRSLQE